MIIAVGSDLVASLLYLCDELRKTIGHRAKDEECAPSLMLRKDLQQAAGILHNAALERRPLLRAPPGAGEALVPIFQIDRQTVDHRGVPCRWPTSVRSCSKARIRTSRLSSCSVRNCRPASNSFSGCRGRWVSMSSSIH